MKRGNLAFQLHLGVEGFVIWQTLAWDNGHPLINGDTHKRQGNLMVGFYLNNVSTRALTYFPKYKPHPQLHFPLIIYLYDKFCSVWKWKKIQRAKHDIFRKTLNNLQRRLSYDLWGSQSRLQLPKCIHNFSSIYIHIYLSIGYFEYNVQNLQSNLSW